jgi:TatD DNase family protein
MHPWNLGPGGTGELARLEDLLRSNPDIGLGEIGLDRGPKARDWQEQEEIFLGQCALAEKYSRPMALHLYKTWQDFFRLAPKIAHQLPVMIHGFTASVELAGQLIKRGCYLSVGWRSLAKGQLWLEELLKLIPREKILAESDYHGDPPLTLEAYQKKMEDLYAALASAGSMEIEGWKEQIHGNAAVFKNGADDRSQGSAVPGT